MLNEDYKEMLQILLNNEVKFLNKQSTNREKDKIDVNYLKKNKNV